MNAPRAEAGHPDGGSIGRLLELLRGLLQTGPRPDPVSARDWDWDDLERLAIGHGVSALLGRAIDEARLEVPEPVARRARLARLGNGLRNLCLVEQRDEIAAALAKEAIDVTFLKGASLLESIYAGEPDLRRLSDIDLLVAESALGPAEVVLEKLGFARALADGEARRGPASAFHRVYVREASRAIPVELHWRLFEPHQPYLFDLGDAAAASVPPRSRRGLGSTFSPEHELAHLCAHLARHAVVLRAMIDDPEWRSRLFLDAPIRLIWLFDVARYLQVRSSAIDWPLFRADCERWFLAEQVLPVFELCERALGVAAPAAALAGMTVSRPRLAERVAARALLRWTTTVEGAARTPREKIRREHVVRSLYAWQWAFPTRPYLRARHPGLGAFRAWLAHAWSLGPQVAKELTRRSHPEPIPGGTAPRRKEAPAASEPRRPSRGPRLRAELRWGAFEDGWLVYDPAADRCVVLNQTAAAIAGRCDGTRTCAEIATDLGQPPQAALEAEIRRVVEELSRASLFGDDPVMRL